MPVSRAKVPPLVAEEYSCADCRLDYRQISVDHAVEVIRALPGRVRAAVAAVPVEERRQRPNPRSWSVTEYLCHLRDVYTSYTIRLHRARIEDQPVLEPMLGDLRARRFRYNERDADGVLLELAVTVAGFCEEVAHTAPDDWCRTVTRLPGEERTAPWLVRQAMHEGEHHLHDIERTADEVATKT